MMHYTNSATKKPQRKQLICLYKRFTGTTAVDLIHTLPEAKWINQNANTHTTRGCLFFANITNPFIYVVLSEDGARTTKLENTKKTPNHHHQI